MLIGLYTDKNGNRWETYKSDNPCWETYELGNPEVMQEVRQSLEQVDALGPFYQRKFRGADDEVGTLAVRGMDSPALRAAAERVRATGKVMHHSKCLCEDCRKCPKCGEMVEYGTKGSPD